MMDAFKLNFSQDSAVYYAILVILRIHTVVLQKNERTNDGIEKQEEEITNAYMQLLLGEAAHRQITRSHLLRLYLYYHFLYLHI
jgi:hypothetical protein